MKKNLNAFIYSTVPAIFLSCYKPSAFLIIISFLFSLQAHAYRPEPGKISASTGPYFYNSDAQSKPELFYENPRVGWSLVAEAILGKSSGLEIGLFYFDKQYLRYDGEDYIIEAINRLYITTGYRHWWSRDFSTALGIYSAYSVGDVESITKTKPFPLSYGTSANEVAEHGLDASIRYEHEFSNKHGFVVDLRYSFNLNPKSGERANHYALNLGYIRRVKVK